MKKLRDGTDYSRRAGFLTIVNRYRFSPFYTEAVLLEGLDGCFFPSPQRRRLGCGGTRSVSRNNYSSPP